MLGARYRIIGNTLHDTESGLESEIHIDRALVTMFGKTSEMILEQTGVTIASSFRAFNEYVFAIQNDLFQFSGMCVTMRAVSIQSDHVRIYTNGVLTRAVIRDNYLITDLDGIEIPIREPEPAPVVRIHVHAFTPQRDTSQRNLGNIARDGQNVHNSFILERFKELYDTIKIHKGKLTWAQTKDAILRVNASNDVWEVLEYMQFQDGFVSKFSENETCILSIVVSCIQDNEDKMKLLAGSIADCKERGIIVCLTGRVARVLNSVFHLYEGKQPASQVRQMLLGQASRAECESLDELVDYLTSENPNVVDIRAEVESWKLDF